jgi:glycosyltransferase involved in cell wall biosynthesis
MVLRYRVRHVQGKQQGERTEGVHLIDVPTMPYVSLITPVHDGARFIDGAVREILRTLEQLERPFEVLVVCDGCTDDTAAIASAIGDARVRVLQYADNHGKGYALCYGIHHARGRLVGWLDADLDVHPRAIVQAARALDRGAADAVLGSKRHPDSAVDYPWQRRILSWGYQRLVRTLLRVDARDTQVGAKLFRREMLDTVVPLLLIKAYAFDLEVLAVGAEFGFDRVTEIPIELDYRFSGSGINGHAVRMMFQDTLAIAYRIHLRRWYVRQYACLQRERMDLLTAAGAGAAAGVELPSAPNGTLNLIRRRVAITVPAESASDRAEQ